MQTVHEYLSVLVVPIRKDYRKLVAADSVHRAMRKNVADHSACLANVLVASFMALCVVDILETVDIANNKAKLGKRPFGQLLVYRRLCVYESLFALYPC